MVGWILVVSGLALAAVALLIGFFSWEVTLLLVVVGLLDAALGAWFILRERQRAA